MVQVSGTFGSRQEEAQRLGRILRPKEGEMPASFYTLVTRDTREMDFAHHRQLFLTEQGYSYEILDESDLISGAASTASPPSGRTASALAVASGPERSNRKHGLPARRREFDRCLLRRRGFPSSSTSRSR